MASHFERGIISCSWEVRKQGTGELDTLLERGFDVIRELLFRPLPEEALSNVPRLLEHLVAPGEVMHAPVEQIPLVAEVGNLLAEERYAAIDAIRLVEDVGLFVHSHVHHCPRLYVHAPQATGNPLGERPGDAGGADDLAARRHHLDVEGYLMKELAHVPI